MQSADDLRLPARPPRRDPAAGGRPCRGLCQEEQRQGRHLPAGGRPGRVVLLTGVTLAAAVATWHFSSIKFQADLGLLLAFMFLLNMLGALVLVPALARFLLPGAREGSVAAPIVNHRR